MRKLLFLPIAFLLFLLVPASITWAQTISTQKGLTTLAFPTAYGTVKVYLPEDIRPGETVSGSLMAEPSGNSARQLEKNREELHRLSVAALGNTIPVTSGPSGFTCTVQEEASGAFEVLLNKPGGGKMAALSMPVRMGLPNPVYPAGCMLPSHALTDAPMRIHGNFDGDLTNTKVTIGERPANLLAESPRECHVRFPSTAKGSQPVSVSEKGQPLCSGHISGVDMQVSTGDLNLRKGQSTYIDIRLTGLQHLPDKALLTISNLTPGVVTMTNGNLQAIPIWPPPDSASGTFSVHCPAVSTTTGEFQVQIDLDLPEPGTVTTPSTELPPGYTSKSCECSVKLSVTSKDNTFTAAATPSCKGQYGVGINTFPMCAVKSVAYSWTVKEGADNVEIKSRKDGKDFTVSPKNKNGFTVCVTVTVTCIDGTVCTATECVSRPGETVVTGSRCACSASCTVVESARDNDLVSYTGDVKAACTGSSGTGETRVACSVRSITYKWTLSDGGKGVAEIQGKSDGPGVKVKIKNKGPYTISLSGTVTCSDGTTCDYYCNAEIPGETITEKFCKLDPKEKMEPLMDGGFDPKYKLTDKMIRRDDYVILGAEGIDFDMLTWTCTPVKPDCPDTKSEKTILLNSRVRYEWEVLSGDGSFVKLGCLPAGQKKDAGDVVIFRPPVVALPVKTADTIAKTEIKLIIIDDNPTQPDDPRVEKKVTVIVKRGKGYPDQYKVTVSGEAMKQPDRKLPPPIDGTCQATGPDWDKLTPITPDPPVIELPGVPDNDKVVAGEWILLQTGDMRDLDKLTLRCVSQGNCPTKPWDKTLEDALQWNWSKTGEGKFLTDISRQYVIYEAPMDIPAGKDFVEVEWKVTVQNSGGKINDNKTAEGKRKIRIYRPGVNLSSPPMDWLPEEDNFVELTSELQYKDGTWKPALAHMSRIHYFELMQVSKEKGVCLNNPVPRDADACNDLYLLSEDGHEAFDDKKPSGCTKASLFQQARSVAPERLYKLKVHARDFGAYGFLRSFANVNKGGHDSIRGEKPVYEPIPSQVSEKIVHPQGRFRKNNYSDDRVTLPLDIDENQLPDGGWITTGGVKVADPPFSNDDEDPLPAGDGYLGDGLSNYEEYRGFKVYQNKKTVHVRTNPGVKDIFIRNRDELDVTLYASVSELDVHEILENQYVDDKRRVVNPNYSKNTHVVDQRGLKLINGGYHAALLGIAVSEGTLAPTIPNFEAEIRVYKERIEKSIKDRKIKDAAAKIRAVIAHELLHGNNVCHHGEGDESAENAFNNKHGLRSGNMACVMRYDNVGTVIRGYDPEDVGSSLCNSPAGTGYNANDQLFGDTAAGRGNCRRQIRVSGRGGRPAPCGGR